MTPDEAEKLADEIKCRYIGYLEASFYFRDNALRDSFHKALHAPDTELKKGPFPESASDFHSGARIAELAADLFPPNSAPDDGFFNSLIRDPLHLHQQDAIRKVFGEGRNIVVATGTASGKTECFLYPILFHLHREHQAGTLDSPGVRALILYPMNALANDQRKRLGDICEELQKAKSSFQFTFGQYIGETPKDKNDKWRNAGARERERRPGEIIFRENMRKNPPHILLTNYSMLEYLLIRPEDSELFDNARGRHWQFLVLDEAHQYRGARGIEMAMLIRRLKNRLHEGGRDGAFRCIATSATIASGEEQKKAVAEFAGNLFGESFDEDGVIFGRKSVESNAPPARRHLFLRSLEGAFISLYPKKKVTLNRPDRKDEDGAFFEVALCRECGQHYFVGQKSGGKLKEVTRDLGSDSKIEFYRPLDDESEENGEFRLCAKCGQISRDSLKCGHGEEVAVKKCATSDANPDQLKECDACGYGGGNASSVREIVYGSDGPNTVIATALHRGLREGRKKILAFADSRQEAAFFAWYLEDSHDGIRDRNLILRALAKPGKDGISLADLVNRLRGIFPDELFGAEATEETLKRHAWRIAYREFLTDERRLSLEGVGLMRWTIKWPDNMKLPAALLNPPWNLSEKESRDLIFALLDSARIQRAVKFDDIALQWSDLNLQEKCPKKLCIGKPRGRGHVVSWDGAQVRRTDLLAKILRKRKFNGNTVEQAQKMLGEIWQTCFRNSGGRNLVTEAGGDGLQINPHWWRAWPIKDSDALYRCGTCERIQTINVAGVCIRHKCRGELKKMKGEEWRQNHYRLLYEDKGFPLRFAAEEHTAQIEAEEARERQKRFRDGKIDVLSSSTTFEVGVDLGDLDAVFLRNVPPEPFNYVQRAGRAGRRGEHPGFVVTYCRRNPHDLYHFAKPEERILKGEVHPPRLSLCNPKIILRHMTAAALSLFFREHADRFNNKAEGFFRDWKSPKAVADFRCFLDGNCTKLGKALAQIIPDDMKEKVGLSDGEWIKHIAGEESRLAEMQSEICADYRQAEEVKKQCVKGEDYKGADRAQKRAKTIADEQTLTMLSRKAVIPKYGFPVDVVELDTHRLSNASKIQLARDLSVAVAEFAPGGQVVANKKVWESCGVKKVVGKEWKIWHYARCEEHNYFRRWMDVRDDTNDICCDIGERERKYIEPRFGFVTQFGKRPEEPQRRPQRVFGTRPCFIDFNKSEKDLHKEKILGVEITEACPGRMAVLCEGKKGGGFYICQECGAGFSKREHPHKSPFGIPCSGILQGALSLGHEFETDVVRLQFPHGPEIEEMEKNWFSYSLAFALVKGMSRVLEVPHTDLSAVLFRNNDSDNPIPPIILYDNVPGGAGLVARLKEESILRGGLEAALERVGGECGCGENESCYGCLRDYGNQFVHPHLRRGTVRNYLDALLSLKN